MVFNLKKPSLHNVSSKFTILCWAALRVPMAHMSHQSAGWTCLERPFESCGKPENGIAQEMQLHLGKSKNWPLYREEMVLPSFRYLNPGLNHTEGGAVLLTNSTIACGNQSKTSDVLLDPSTFPFRNKVCQSAWSWIGDQTPQWASCVFPPVVWVPKTYLAMPRLLAGCWETQLLILLLRS